METDTQSTTAVEVAGPWYEELSVGQLFDSSPGLTLTSGHAALHQAIIGDRLRLALDADLSASVTKRDGCLAHPSLVTDIAIGQSTLATQRVVANLFYRGLIFYRAPLIGDTLRSTTEVVALRDTSRRPGRAPTGLAVLRVRTVDQLDRVVLDFHRCAMLPMRDETGRPGHADDLDAIPTELPDSALRRSTDGWDLGLYRSRVPGTHASGLAAGTRYSTASGDTVSGAPELVRLSLNIASAHTDASSTTSGKRLVYGGHTIGVALAQVTRALPNLVTVVAWHSCEHLAPVFEGDVLRSLVTIESLRPLGGGAGSLVTLRVQTTADRMGASVSEAVLDWSLVGVMA